MMRVHLQTSRIAHDRTVPRTADTEDRHYPAYGRTQQNLQGNRQTQRREYLARLIQARKNNRWRATYNATNTTCISWNADSLLAPAQRRDTASFCAKQGIAVAALQETRADVAIDETRGQYRYISTAAPRNAEGHLQPGGVGFMIHRTVKLLRKEIFSSSMMQVEVNLCGENITFFTAYAPQEHARGNQFNFWPTLKKAIEDCRGKKIFLGIDANGRIGRDSVDMFNEIGPNCSEKTTRNGLKLLKCVEGLGYRVENTLFKPKKNKGVHTFQRGTTRSQIDFTVTKGFAHQRPGWAIKHCSPKAEWTMGKPRRTHIPLLHTGAGSTG